MDANDAIKSILKDPVCGMTVTEQSPHFSSIRISQFIFAVPVVRLSLHLIQLNIWLMIQAQTSLLQKQNLVLQKPSLRGLFTPARCTQR